MKKIVLALTICCLPFYALAQTRQAPDAGKETASPQSAVPKIKTGALQVIPDEVFSHELKDLDGQSFFLSTFRGQVFVINLWATWCGPCRLEIPELNKIYEDYSGRGVEFVGLTIENPKLDAARVREFVKEYKMEYKIVWVDAEAALPLMAGNSSIPQTLVVAADGRIVRYFRGYSTSERKLLRDGIEKALDPAYEPPPAPAPSAAPGVRP
jgi:thiol-disulfide isomerase/thioredoxin